MANVATGNEEPKKPGGTIAVPRSKRGMKGYFSEVKREIKKVSWPTRPETTRLTGVVLGVCAILVFILTGLGAVFGFIVDFLTHL
jgi:preprotein translocase subunit SecE